MTNSYKLGNSKLVLGTGPGNITGQLRKAQINISENVSTLEAIPLLNNTELAKEEEAEYGYTLELTLLQDLTAAGIIDFSWAHPGEEVAFVLVPELTLARAVKGIVYPVPIMIGGEATKPKNRAQSDTTWRIKGTPVFGVYNPVGDLVTEDA